MTAVVLFGVLDRCHTVNSWCALELNTFVVCVSTGPCAGIFLEDALCRARASVGVGRRLLEGRRPSPAGTSGSWRYRGARSRGAG